MTGWQPIATAPKTFASEVPEDGQALLLFGENIWGLHRVTIGFWTTGEFTSHGEGWWDATEGAFLNPTHWMPLPDAPATILEEG